MSLEVLHAISPLLEIWDCWPPQLWHREFLFASSCPRNLFFILALSVSSNPFLSPTPNWELEGLVWTPLNSGMTLEKSQLLKLSKYPLITWGFLQSTSKKWEDPERVTQQGLAMVKRYTVFLFSWGMAFGSSSSMENVGPRCLWVTAKLSISYLDGSHHSMWLDPMTLIAEKSLWLVFASEKKFLTALLRYNEHIIKFTHVQSIYFNDFYYRVVHHISHQHFHPSQKKPGNDSHSPSLPQPLIITNLCAYIFACSEPFISMEPCGVWSFSE